MLPLFPHFDTDGSLRDQWRSGSHRASNSGRGLPRPALSGAHDVSADTWVPAYPGLHCCQGMRRTLAVALMMVFSLTLIAPLFGPDADASLPPCCRGSGKHHCMMGAMERSSSDPAGLTRISEKCPCFPAGTFAAHSSTYKLEAGSQFCAQSVRHSAIAPQTEALCPISFLRSHPMRGPPAPLA